MNNIIMDLEATCWNDGTSHRASEIIEVGAVRVVDLEIKDEFQAFVRPKLHGISKFCTKLTTITQNDVDKAEPFPYVNEKFEKWVKKGGDNYHFYTWGNYDNRQYRKDCDLNRVKFFWDNHFSNLKTQAKKLAGMEDCGIIDACKILGIKFNGTLHRGIDDARHCAKVFVLINS